MTLELLPATQLAELSEADPRSFGSRCGGRESKFLAAGATQPPRSFGRLIP
jgi:hypothetical protein